MNLLKKNIIIQYQIWEIKMELVPDSAKKIKVEGSTVDFYELKNGNSMAYFFDTSLCPVPEPMINAMVGLKLINENNKLVMINHKPPIALFPRIQQNYNYEIEELEDGRYKIEFTYKSGTKNKVNFDNNFCDGI